MGNETFHWDGLIINEHDNSLVIKNSSIFSCYFLNFFQNKTELVNQFGSSSSEYAQNS